MDWRTAVVVLALLFHADGFSKYGRTCKDIGCLNSEVCVLAEDQCSYGQTSNCGTYPTCKKKSLVQGSNAEPQPSVPKPTPQSPTRNFDAPPNYPAPAPPSNTHSGSPYGGNSPYDSSPYGGSSSHGGNSPYGSNSNYGGGSPYGNSGGNSPYGGSSPYGNSGGNSPYGGSSPYGGGSPYDGSSNRGGSNPYNPSSGGGKSPLDSLFNTLNNFAGGQGGGSSPGGAGLSNIFGNILGNLSKSGGGLTNLFNTRPIMENPNYSSYSSNSRSSNPQNYPSGSLPTSQQPSQNRNYGQNYAQHNRATTRRPMSYGWNVSVTVILTYLTHQYLKNMIKT